MIHTQRILYLQSRETHSSIPSQKRSPFLSLSEACLSLTPKASLYKTELFLDIASTENIFYGEEGILFKAHHLFSTFGIKPQLVLTDRPEWARALAIQEESIIPKGKSQEHLFRLPIERLEHCGDPVVIENELSDRHYLIRFMQRVGLKTVADFAHLSPLAITRRFGKMGLILHDWVMGQRTLCLPPFLPQEPICETIDCDEIFSLEVLIRTIKNILPRLMARLQGRGLVAKQICLAFLLDSREKVKHSLNLTNPTRDEHTIESLFREFLSRFTWDSPLLTLEVTITDALPYKAGQLSLFDETENRFSDLANYVGRLRSRFGEKAVGFPCLLESYLPEHSWEVCWPPESASSVTYPIPNRPLFLFVPPEPYTPPKEMVLTLSEHLATEWWHEGGFRKYFVARDLKGRALWIFWDYQKNHWFLHGTFD